MLKNKYIVDDIVDFVQDQLVVIRSIVYEKS